MKSILCSYLDHTLLKFLVEIVIPFGKIVSYITLIMNVSMSFYCIISNIITIVCQLFSQHIEVIFDALLTSINIHFISFYRIEWLYRYNLAILGCDLYAFITFLYIRCLE